jgi:nucleoside-diphosphate-sugar epimerase
MWLTMDPRAPLSFEITSHARSAMSHHLVVGAGPIGSATARRLADAGHRVVVVSRSGGGPDDARITLRALDATDTESLVEVAAGATALYNCVNPAYDRWPTEWPPIAAAMLSAAERSGAVLATVSNLYGYGPVDGPLTEDLPLATTGRKGQVRAQMFTDAVAAHQAGRIRMTEVRGSDYVGPGAESHLGDRVVPRLLAGKSVSVLGDPDQPHTWTYTEDMARTLVAAAATEHAWGRAWHVPSNPPRTQREAIGDLARVAGVHGVSVRAVPNVLLRVLGVANPVMRELQETRYQFERPFVMSSRAAEDTFGLTPTAWDDVLTATLRSYGWVPTPGRRVSE